MTRETTVAFSGHKPKDLWGYYHDDYYEQLQQHISDIILPDLYNRGYRTFLSGGGQGFDTCVFWAVEQFKFMHPDVENIIFSPCLNQDKFWGDVGFFGRRKYKQALDRADEVRNITEVYIPNSFTLRNQALINNSSCLVAMYNGTPEEKGTGVAATIKMADKQDNYNIVTLETKMVDNIPVFSTNERISKGVAESKRVKLTNRNLIGVENNNPVPPLPEDGFGDVICFDTETTGFSFGKYDELLQIAIVGSNGNEWVTYIRPEKKETWASAMKANHITPEMVKDAPSSFAVMQAIYPHFKNAKVIVGHNVQFDLNFLEAAGLTVGTDVWDTCVYFRQDMPDISHKLGKAVEVYCPEFLEEYKAGAHDALTDTRSTMRVYEMQYQKEQEKLTQAQRCEEPER